MSNSLIYGSRCLIGVSGLIAKPALILRFFIFFNTNSTSLTASKWIVIIAGLYLENLSI